MRIFGWILVLLLLAPGFASAEQLTEKTARAQLEDSRTLFIELLTARIDEVGHSGNYNEVVRLTKMQIDLDPQWFESYSLAGWLLWSMKRFNEAEEIYKLGIKNNPKHFRMYYELGNMYWLTSRRSIYNASPKRSKELLGMAAVQLHESIKYSAPPDVHRQYAHALHKLGRYDEERTILQGVLKRNPSDAVAKRDLKRLSDVGK